MESKIATYNGSWRIIYFANINFGDAVIKEEVGGEEGEEEVVSINLSPKHLARWRGSREQKWKDTS